MVLYEDAANIAIDILFTLYEQEKIGYENYYLDPSEENLENLLAERQMWFPIRGRDANLAFQMHVDKWSEERLTKFLLELGIMPKDRIYQSLNFIKSAPWQAYHFNYYVGEKLIKEKFGESLTPQDYKTLLTNPLVPSSFV